MLGSSDIRRRLAGGAAWSFVASVASRAFALLASVAVARLLGKEGFGQLGMVQSTIDMFGALAGFQMGLTATKYVAEFRARDPDKAGRVVALSSCIAWLCGGITAILLFVSAPLLASRALAAPQLAPLLQLSSVSLLLSAVAGAQSGALAGFEAFKEIALVNFISGLAILGLRVTGAITFGLWGAVLGMVVAQAVAWAVNYVALRRVANRFSVMIRYSHCFRELPVLWQFGLPAVLGTLISMPVTWLCNAMLVNTPNGYLEMGLLNAANQWYFVILFVPGLMGQAAMPVLFDRLAAGDHHQGRSIFRILLKMNAALFGLVVVLCCFSKLIMQGYGREFGGGWQTMMVMLVAAGLFAVQMPAGYMMAAKGRMWTAFCMTVGWGICLVVTTGLLVHKGAIGVAWAKLLAIGLHCCWSFAWLYVVMKREKTPSVRLPETLPAHDLGPAGG